jgi:hypothetical protein
MHIQCLLFSEWWYILYSSLCQRHDLVVLVHWSVIKNLTKESKLLSTFMSLCPMYISSLPTSNWTLVHAVIWEREIVKDDCKCAFDLGVCEQVYVTIMEDCPSSVPVLAHVCVQSVTLFRNNYTCPKSVIIRYPECCLQMKTDNLWVMLSFVENYVNIHWWHFIHLLFNLLFSRSNMLVIS